MAFKNIISICVMMSVASICFAGKADEILHRKLNAFLPSNHKNCGSVKNHKLLNKNQYKSLERCIRTAYQKGDAFIFSKEGYGIDSYHAEGILGLKNSSGVYVFAYDSSPSGSLCCNYALHLSLCHMPSDSTRTNIETDCNLLLAEHLNEDEDESLRFSNNRNLPKGYAGVQEALKQRLIRKATEEDVQAWLKLESENTPPEDIPPVFGDTKNSMHSTESSYVVLKPFTFPLDVDEFPGDGRDSYIVPTFYVPKNITLPKGNKGWATVCSFKLIKCY